MKRSFKTQSLKLRIPVSSENRAKLNFVLLFCCLISSSILYSLEAQTQETSETKKTKIACVGNSITYGTGIINREKNAYPSQLQNMLNEDKFEVINFGVGGATLLKKGREPYWVTSAYQEALNYRPDIVLIKLGTNDSKLPNRLYLGEFKNNYKELIASFKKRNQNARIVLLLPLPSFEKDTSQIWNPIIKNKVIPLIEEVAFETNSEIIDLHSLFVDQETLIPDKLHPSAMGATIIARRLYELIQFDSKDHFDLVKKMGIKKFQLKNFHGYEQFNFDLNGVPCKIVRPKKVNKEYRWVWRARFWGHEPQTDIALLERGFHLVYCDVSNLFGGEAAVTRWNTFYQTLVNAGLHSKTVLEGMSRGGLIIYNWAAENSEKVACVYADAPVLDGTSWPGGFGTGTGSKSDWESFKKVYQIDSEDDIKKATLNPLQNIDAIVKGGFPMLHVCGVADKVVPVDENTRPFEREIQDNGGDIQVVYKEGIGHHPHSLKNPSVIVDFILKSTKLKTNFALVPSSGSTYLAAAGWKKDKGWWYQKEEIDSLCRSIDNVDLILIGNSITQGWGQRNFVSYSPGKKAASKYLEELNWINAGISGDRTEQVALRIIKGNFEQCNPEFIALTIGVNNFFSYSAEEIAEGLENDLRLLQQKVPDATIIFTGPLPSGIKKISDRRKKYDRIHQIIAPLGNNTNVRYFNLLDLFSDQDGNLDETLYAGDGVHLKPDGYMVWGEFLKTTFLELKK